MEGESNGMEGSQNRQCQAGCGFFGSSATDGFCSMCYKEAVKKKQQPPASSMKVTSPQRATPSVTAVEPRPPKPIIAFSKFVLQNPEKSSTQDEEENKDDEKASTEASSMASTVQSESDSSSGSEGKKKSNRCLECRKKVGLTGFECRCGGLFCSTHRYSDKHNCSFDYRQLGAEEIRKNNPIVVSEKINKI